LMHSPRANNNSNIAWIKNFDSDIPDINWAKHLYPLVGPFTEWNAGGNDAFYSKIPAGLKMFISGIQTPGMDSSEDIDNVAIVLAFDDDSDSDYFQNLIIKASSQSATNLLVIGNLSSPISLLFDVSCYRFLYIHMSVYYH